MSDGQRPNSGQNDAEEPSAGPNLTLLYSLIALALAAIGIATMIVLPFYHRK
jgi:hypothetical protein